MLDSYKGAQAQMLDGKLFVLATPIGNLSDISDRAKAVLASVTLIAAEDTRHTGRLLSHLGINNKLVSLHDHNESQKSDYLLERLAQGDQIALVSDAGTPLISDPGFILVRKAKQAGYPVLTVPGPCALIAALSVSGLSSQKFTFEGFIPAKQLARRALLEEFGRRPVSTVFYESTHRIRETLALMNELYPERLMCLARELTKQYETVITKPVREVWQILEQDSQQQRGEFVLILDGQPLVQGEFDELNARLLERLLKSLPPKEACAIVAEHAGLDKKQLYKWAVARSR